MADPLRPQFFVTRQNGSMVPLIAMDELPATIKIRDVQRSLSPYDVSGMTGVGVFDARHRQHIFENTVGGRKFTSNGGPLNSSSAFMGFQLDDNHQNQGNLADKSLMASSYAPADNHTPTTSVTNNAPINGDEIFPQPAKLCGNYEQAPPASLKTAPVNGNNIFAQPPKAYGIEEQAPPFALFPSLTSPTPAVPLRVDRNATGPSTLPPWHDLAALPLRAAPGVKEYCSYWLRHGECDYAQQGCLYRHEMPLDQQVLERLGLRDIPRWYREKHGLGSYLAGGTTTTGILDTDVEKKGAMGRNWRAPPAEGLLEGNGRKPGFANDEGMKGPFTMMKPKAAFQSSTSNDAGVFSSNNNLRSPTLTPPSTTFPRQNSAFNATANGHHYPPFSKSSSSRPDFTRGGDCHKIVPAPNPPKETARERQMRDTIAALDAYELRDRERLLITAKYAVLEPEKRSTPSSPRAALVTPTTSEASSESEEIRMEEAAAIRSNASAPSTGSMSPQQGSEHGVDAVEKTEKLELMPEIKVAGEAKVQTPCTGLEVQAETPVTARSGNRKMGVRTRRRVVRKESALSTPSPRQS